MNWSEELRKSILEVLDKRARIEEAERLREYFIKKYAKKGTGEDSTAIIRRFRDTRYGPNSN